MAAANVPITAAETPPAGPDRVAIVGAGALGQQMAQHLRQAATHQVVGFFDDTLPPGTPTPNGTVLGPLAAIDAHRTTGFDALLLGIGYHHRAARERIFGELLGRGIPFARFVHPAAYVDRSARLGAGAFVSPGCTLDLNCSLADNVFLYPGCVVAHDTTIGAHSLLAPGVRLAGNVRIGERCFLGIGTTIIDGLTLAPDIVTGGGSVVVRDLPAAGLYVGVPARRRP